MKEEEEAAIVRREAIAIREVIDVDVAMTLDEKGVIVEEANGDMEATNCGCYF